MNYDQILSSPYDEETSIKQQFRKKWMKKKEMACQRCNGTKNVKTLVFDFKNFTRTPPLITEQKYNICDECKNDLYRKKE